MKSKRLANSFKLIMIILVLCVAVFVGFYIKNKQNPFSGIVNTFKKDSTLFENLNGIYTYKETLEKGQNPFSGCTVNEIDNYILIINDNYKVFRSSCMGTFFQEGGNIDKLDIAKDAEDPYIQYNGHKYEKDYYTTMIAPNNRIADKLNRMDLSQLTFIMKETQFPGNYYKIDVNLRNNEMIRFYFKKSDEEQDKIVLQTRQEKLIYSYSFSHYDELPDFYNYGRKVVAIEKGDNPNNNMKYGYNFKVINEENVEYNLEQMFPIKVNNEELTLDHNSVYVMFDEKDRVFKMFVGYNKKMCVEDGTEHVPVYYEFKIGYNYSAGYFEKPEFIKVGFEDEKCNYISNYVKGD